MRARMLVESRNASTNVDYRIGQELEGQEAEYQIALGHAEEIVEAAPEVKKAPKPKKPRKAAKPKAPKPAKAPVKTEAPATEKEPSA